MKPALKKILSAFLAILIIVLPIPALCAEGEAVQRTCPNIDVHGFMASHLYSDKNDPNSALIWPADAKGIYQNNKKQLPEILKLARKGNWTEFSERISGLITQSLFPVYTGMDGEVHDNSGVYFVYPKPEEITEQSEVYFQYDWRRDPIAIASDLNDFVNYVLECSGAEKVTIECHSLGGVIVTTYLSIYGNEKVKAVAFNSTAVFGFSAAARMMSGDVKFDSKALQEYLYFAFDYSEYSHFINGMIMAAKEVGLLDFIAKQSNNVFTMIGSTVAKEAIIPLFGNWPTIWALVPDEDFDAAFDNVFNKVYKGEDHSALISKIENYNTLVRSKRTDVLRDLSEKANVYVICRYGYSSAPVSMSYDSIGDGIIDAKYSSFGATTSRYGQSLDKKYLQEIPPKYIAPNGSIDASTCMFPEQTWFVYSMRHFKSPKPLADFIDYLLCQEEQVTVTTFEQYPRYMAYDSVLNTIGEDNNNYSMTLFRRIMIGIKEFFRLIFHSIFGSRK